MLNDSSQQFPFTRLRRNRRTDWSRRLVRENHVSANDLIWPVFVVEGTGQEIPVASMPGVTRYSVDKLVDEVKKASELGIPAIAIFPSRLRRKKLLTVKNLPTRKISFAARCVRFATPKYLLG